MAVKRRRSKHRAPVDHDEQAWLRGEDDSGFVEFLRPEQLRALWDEYGDKELFEWSESIPRPVARVC